MKLTNEFMWRSWKIIGQRGGWPSTGWFGLAMAMAVAREIGAQGPHAMFPLHRPVAPASLHLLPSQ